MKAKNVDETPKRKTRPFLLFPVIDNKENCENSKTMPKNPGLKLFTKIRPTKIDANEKERPQTATLEKPAVLDIKLMAKLDMSTIRKEFLNITNLCRIPIALKVKRKKQVCRPLSLCGPEIATKNVRKFEPGSDDSWEDEESTKSARIEKIKPKSSTVKKITLKSVTKKSAILSDKNNNKDAKNASVQSVDTEHNFGKNSKKIAVPEPCTTCGRPNQPERFHSHPETPLKPLKKVEILKIPVKNSVQKPIAIRYKSKQTSIKKPLPIRKPSLPSQVLEHSPPGTAQNNSMDAKPKSRAGSAKRTLTCYICGREFGTASLPLHEPKCLKKWKIENSNLPQHLQRSVPIKPNCPTEEWNQKAIEIFKSKLLPCSNCGRTFNPESLVVHQRSCKENIKIKLALERKTPLPDLTIEKPSTPKSPLNIECNICGKRFSTHSIKIHENQCLKKKQLAGEMSDISNKQGNRPKASGKTNESPSSRPSSERRPQIFPCYLCGKMFSIASIHIHEPQCLKMWRLENEKLPPNRRRDEPIKPEIKYTPDGKIDFEATTEDCWQIHLSQLVPCKICSRTFNPDRVDIHEKNCKG